MKGNVLWIRLGKYVEWPGWGLLKFIIIEIERNELEIYLFSAILILPFKLGSDRLMHMEAIKSGLLTISFWQK